VRVGAVVDDHGPGVHRPDAGGRGKVRRAACRVATRPPRWAGRGGQSSEPVRPTGRRR